MTTMISTQIAAQIPEKWIKHSVEDTINIPIEMYWDLSFKLNLEEIGSTGNYENLPKIIKTIPVKGAFTTVGESRRVIFDNGKTLLESILEWQKPGRFTYELTELEIDLKRVARRARGNFSHFQLPDNKTRIVWTYGFDQKNLIFKWLIKRYIKRTHQFWMRDTLAEMKRQAEAMYKELSNGK
ncbi:SRPBCC family protein [Flavihumibacter cheonanensis]|uniref:hypothetical protein n=1 Tax=Flavihumibacter cheonanensis TaxID=1442385 RepID=UPI001EF7FF42|nr:hypothetical protein [Flavihumibacter cheonanensis]MCG7751722.1 hypothetical protein [Flavihumibacter cheonanensis]